MPRRRHRRAHPLQRRRRGAELLRSPSITLSSRPPSQHETQPPTGAPNVPAPAGTASAPLQIGIPLRRGIRRLGGGAERGASGRETPPETQVQRSRPPLEGPSDCAERRGSEPMAATSRPIRPSGPYKAPVKSRMHRRIAQNGARADRTHHARPFTNPPRIQPPPYPATQTLPPAAPIPFPGRLSPASAPLPTTSHPPIPLHRIGPGL
jgi:hypothetical protein